VLLAAGVLAAACSSSTTTPPANAGSGNGTTSTTSGSASAVVHVGRVGSLGTVLTNAQGMTLYRYTPDKKNVSNCTGSCASLWPPLTVPAGTASVTAVHGAGGTLGTIKRSDGSTQVTFNGIPLYTYTGDAKAGQANGEGLDGIWFVIKANGSLTSGSSGSTTTSTSGGSSGGYGY
jgi:predicted lipoprotein with Yx(FWY)xxD motif